MNNYNELKKLYIDRGWVVCRKLFSLNEIKSINLIINDFLEKKLKKVNKKSRIINFTDNSKKNIENINSFHELAQCEEIKNLANKNSIIDVAKEFLNSDPEFRGCELFAKPAKNGLPSPDHQDNYYWNVKLLLLLFIILRRPDLIATIPIKLSYILWNHSKVKTASKNILLGDFSVFFFVPAGLTAKSTPNDLPDPLRDPPRDPPGGRNRSTFRSTGVPRPPR